MAKSKKLTNREKAQNVKIRKELKEKGILPPDQDILDA